MMTQFSDEDIGHASGEFWIGHLSTYLSVVDFIVRAFVAMEP